ncbi:MAG: tetratricopeptide repeat protein [Desulfobacterales bacterium]|jgi:tetratricopeptide (TPR) repeat protein|nr:tetratricopeptide repeat protein [Desulfobacterales bacterium]
MSILKLFSGKTPEEHEQKGDELFSVDLWGKAKVEYERALDKLEKTSPHNYELKTRLQEKMNQAKEALALGHKQNADDLMESGFYDDARELYALSRELTEDSMLKNDLEIKLKELDFQLDKTLREELPDFDYETPETEEPEFPEEGDEYFRALCGTLPMDVQKDYLSYGNNFKKGYMALNRGDFATAADYLSRVMEEDPSADSYVPLELATAYLNLGKHSEAQQLLEAFIESRPQALPAYQLLCEIFWERKAFDQAEALLASVPEELTESVAVFILKGETHYHAGNFADAKDFYRNFMATYGWNELVARALAKTHEAMNELANARNVYREIMDQCRSCHARLDPFIKQRYADLCFDSGMYNNEILELYLSLAQEIPANATDYFEKVSRICTAQGNEGEARRFRAIAEKLASK